MSTKTYEIGELADPTLKLDLGIDHPTRIGLTQLTLSHTFDVVEAADLQPGFTHRGVEKLFEVRDYRSAVMLADRHDWHAAFSGELSIALACETAMGLVAPKRAQWVRALIAELARSHSHLAYLSWINGDSMNAQIRSSQERIREHLADLSGNRIHPMLVRIGGMAADPTPQWLRTSAELARDVHVQAEALFDLASECPAGIGVLTAEDVNQYGLSGPVSAACGIVLDERCTQPVYDELEQPGPSPVTTGDSRARFCALANQLAHSSRLIQACVEGLPDGPIDTKLAKIIKVPESKTYVSLAAPWGSAGCFLVSRGDRTPWRLGLRTPTFANCSALPKALVNSPMNTIGEVVASLGYSVGDLDR